MIKTSFISALLLAGSLFVKAQSVNHQGQAVDTAQHHAWRQGYREKGFGQHGGLHYTPEQRKQRFAIHEDYRHKQDELYKQDNLTLGEYKTQLLALQKEKKARLKALITPEQQQQIDRRKSQASENAQVMAAARLERMKIRLQLTDDQAARIKTQDEAFRTQLHSIRDNDDLLPEQKREQMHALFAQQKEAIASILTPDQQAKLKTVHFGGFRQGRGA